MCRNNRTRGGDGHTPSRRLRKRSKPTPKSEIPFHYFDDLDYAKAQQFYFDAMSIQEEAC